MMAVPSPGNVRRQGNDPTPLGAKSHKKQHRCRIWVVLFGLGLGGALCGNLAVAGPSGASTPWTITPSPSQGVNQHNLLNRVSCSDPAHCVAVGGYFNGALEQTLVETLSGGTWTITPSPNQGVNQNNVLFGVSCSGPAQCVAVGGHFNGIANQTLVETLSGGTWTITPSPNQGINRENDLPGVSCADATHCVAVGDYFNGTTFQTLVETWSGGAWTITPSPNQGINQENDLVGASCPDAAHCVAVGRHNNGIVKQTLVETLSGGTWTITPSPNQGTNEDNVFAGVSCSDATHCGAVGDYNNGTATQTLVESLSGGTWTITPSPNQGTNEDNVFAGVSCTDATHCVAVGNHNNGTTTQTLVESLSGGTWTITPSPNQVTTLLNDLNAVSCSDETHCAAVGNYFNGAALQTLVLSGSVTQGGYDLAGKDGGVFVFPLGQTTGFFGSLPGLGVQVNNVMGIVPTNDFHGYDLVGSDGGVFVFPLGQASGFFGSLPGLGIHVNNIVGIVASPDGQGYFLVGKDGGVFTFGDAPFLGSLPALGISASDIVGIAPTSDGKGYWVVAASGAVYGFGDAKKFGDLPGLGVNVSNVVSIVPTPDAKGYWLIGSDGGIFPFGDAVFQNSLPGLGVTVNNIVGAVPTG